MINKSAWKYYTKLYRGSGGLLSLIVLISIGRSLITFAVVLLIRYLIDTLIPGGDSHLLLLYGAGACLLLLLGAGLALWMRRTTLAVTKKVTQRLREELLAKLYTISRAYHTKADRGKLHSILVVDTMRLDHMSNALIAQILLPVVISVPLGLMLIHLNWLLFLIAVSVSPVLFWFNKSMSGRLKERVEAFRLSIETFSKGMWFALWMMDLTVLQAAQPIETEKQEGHFEEVLSADMSMAWLETAHGTVQSLLVDLTGIIVLVAGGVAIAAGSMTLGELVTFYVAAVMFRRYVQPLLSCIPVLIAGNESLVEIFKILEVKDLAPYSGKAQIAFSGKIVLDSVTFGYEDVPVLADVSLTIDPGMTVAVVGPNGSGKTTIAHLVLGLYRPQQGQLCADDYPFDRLDINHLRRRIGVVPQAPLIFPGTILENITYGWPDAPLEDVHRASEMATAHEFIRQLPEGYDTFVGESGLLLSGGERQKIAIARALLRQPRLLVLDEPTNHLDETAVQKLMSNLKAMESQPAILIISHDMSIVAEAQHVYVLKEGRVKRGDSLESLSVQPVTAMSACRSEKDNQDQ